MRFQCPCGLWGLFYVRQQDRRPAGRRVGEGFNSRVGSGVFSTGKVGGSKMGCEVPVSMPVWALGSFLLWVFRSLVHLQPEVSMPVWALGSFLPFHFDDFRSISAPFGSSRPVDGSSNGLSAHFCPFLLVMSTCEHRHNVQNRPHARKTAPPGASKWPFLAHFRPQLASIASSGPTPPDARNARVDRYLVVNVHIQYTKDRHQSQ